MVSEWTIFLVCVEEKIYEKIGVESMLWLKGGSTSVRVS